MGCLAVLSSTEEKIKYYKQNITFTKFEKKKAYFERSRKISSFKIKKENNSYYNN